MQFNLDEEAFRFWDDMLGEVQRHYERRCALARLRHADAINVRVRE